MITEKKTTTISLWQQRAARFICLLAVAVPALEVAAHFAVRRGVPTWQDWQRAAAFIRPRLQDSDLLVVAPAWADPLLRWAIGDRIALADAGRSDLAAHRRLWAIAIGDAKPKDAPSSRPEIEQPFGRLRVRRWSLPATDERIYADLTSDWREAEVQLGNRSCPMSWQAPPVQGGLGAGPTMPAARFVCDAGRPWLWVGATVMHDLQLQPRRCLWMHPEGNVPVRIRYRNQALGQRLVLYGGIAYQHERTQIGGPVRLQVEIDGRPVADLWHRDGEGWRRYDIATQQTPIDAAKRGDVTLSVTAADASYRFFCWSASLRGPAALSSAALASPAGPS